MRHVTEGVPLILRLRDMQEARRNRGAGGGGVLQTHNLGGGVERRQPVERGFTF